jgi:hypothetical protein
VFESINNLEKAIKEIEAIEAENFWFEEDKSPTSIIDEIIQLTKAQEQFWSNSHGWAPSAAADLLEAARLDRQLSFTYTLYDYLTPFAINSAEAHYYR